MSTLPSNSEQKENTNRPKQLVLRSLQLYYTFVGLLWTRFSPVEFMTPLYIDDPHGFKLSDQSLVQILLRAGECLIHI